MKKLITCLSLVAAALVAAPPASAAIALSFTPTATHINIGDSVTIDVGISGLGAEVLSGYDLNFVYNPAILNWNLIIASGTPFGASSGLNTNGLPEGDLGLDIVSFETDADLAASQADAFQLFSFNLTGMADGTTFFTLGPDLDFDRLFSGLADANGLAQALNVNVGGVCIGVGTGNCTVPEPASYSLFGLALAGALLPGALRRLRQARGA